MKNRELFKKAGEVFIQYQRQLLIYSFVWAIILTIAIALSCLFQAWFVLVFFLFFPIQFALNFVAKKVSEHINLEDRDFYFGFKNMQGSLIFGAKTSMRGFGYGLLTAFIISMLSSIAIVLLFTRLEPTLWVNVQNNIQDITYAYNTILSVDWAQELFMYGSLLSIVGFAFVYAFSGLPSNMAEYVCFDLPFDPDSGVRISRRIVSKHKKQYFGLNCLLVLAVLIAGGLGYSFYYFTYGSIFTNSYAVVLIASLISSIFLAPIDIYYLLVKYQFFFAYGKPELLQILGEMKDRQERAQKPAEGETQKPDDSHSDETQK